MMGCHLGAGGLWWGFHEKYQTTSAVAVGFTVACFAALFCDPRGVRFRFNNSSTFCTDTMTNSRSSNGNGWEFGATNCKLLALSKASRACHFRSHWSFSKIIPKPPVKFYLLAPQLFQTMTLVLTSSCGRPRRQTDRFQTELVRSL